MSDESILEDDVICETSDNSAITLRKKRKRSLLWDDFDSLPNNKFICKNVAKFIHSTLKRHMGKEALQHQYSFTVTKNSPKNS